jgi:hypothetical protein
MQEMSYTRRDNDIWQGVVENGCIVSGACRYNSQGTSLNTASQANAKIGACQLARRDPSFGDPGCDLGDI